MIFIKTLVKRIFQYEARRVLARYKPKIIVIVGSVGKTITKEALYLVLSKKFFVRRSEKSFTTDLGIPLAIIGCSIGNGSILQWIQNLLQGVWLLAHRSRYPDYLILELDGDKPGDLQSVSTWLVPDILVLTAIGDAPAHIEAFGNIETFLYEKKHIVGALAQSGVIVYNADDVHATTLAQSVEATRISCGIGGGVNISATPFQILYGGKQSLPTGMQWMITHTTESYPISLFDTFGVSIQYAFLLACGVGISSGISLSDCISALATFRPLAGRMRTVMGIKETYIIDDTYNASPIAMSQAVDVFSQMNVSGRKIAVVGDMLELGRYSADAHRAVGRELFEFASYVFCVGIRSRKMVNELLSLGFDESHIFSFDTSERAGLELQNLLLPGDLVLVKGSQAMRMERVVEEIMRHPKDADKLLVRQEPEWLERD